MTPDTQRELFAALAETLSLAPDIRFGQLMAHLGFLGEDYLDRGLSDLEDDELLAVLYRHRAELLARNRAEPVAGPAAPSAVVSISRAAKSRHRLRQAFRSEFDFQWRAASDADNLFKLKY